MAKILIVDDELPLLRNLASYLGSFSEEFEVVTAPSAEEGLEALENDLEIDLLLTDVRLPGMDGIELVRRAVGLNPELRVLVMTAFSSSDLKRTARGAGALRYLEKPLDLKELRSVLNEALAARSGWSGSLGGLDIFDFTQLFSLSGKNTAIRVTCGDRMGTLVFRDGNLVHASSADVAGDEAFYLMTTWEGGSFEELPAKGVSRFRRNVASPTSHLMMEAARLRDEANREDEIEPEEELDDFAGLEEIQTLTQAGRTTKEEREMAVKDHLAEFDGIEGFEGAAVFTAQGDMLEGVAKGKLDIKTVGMFANNALLNAQKATDQMGVGRGNLVQVRAPKAIVLMRCLNEATDFAATAEGKAHFHTVVVMNPDGNTGMATMILDKVVGKIADELR